MRGWPCREYTTPSRWVRAWFANLLAHCPEWRSVGIGSAMDFVKKAFPDPLKAIIPSSQTSDCVTLKRTPYLRLTRR